MTEKDFLSVIPSALDTKDPEPVLKRFPARKEMGDPDHLSSQIDGRKGIDVYNTIISHLADEAEYLKYKREVLEEEDPTADHSAISQRRAVILGKISDTIREREKVSASIDLEHPVIRLVVKYTFSKFKEVMDEIEAVSGQQRDFIFQEVANRSKNYKEDLAEELEQLGISASSK